VQINTVIAEQGGLAVMQQICILNVPGLNLSWGCPLLDFLWFSSAPVGKCHNTTMNWPLLSYHFEFIINAPS